MNDRVRISVCGVMEYACSGPCGDWIREHEAVWLREDGAVDTAGGSPYCPACFEAEKARREKPERREAPEAA